MRPDSAEAEQAANRHFLGIGSSKRTMAGNVAVEILEHRARLDLTEARSRVLEFEFEHHELA